MDLHSSITRRYHWDPCCQKELTVLHDLALATSARLRAISDWKEYMHNAQSVVYKASIHV